MFVARRLIVPSLVSALTIISSACDKGGTNPASPDGGAQFREAIAALPSIPFPTSYSPTTQTPDQVKLCKDVSSPAGTYTFNITATNSQSDDQVAKTATLLPGQCTIIFNRTGHTFQYGSFAMVTITELIPGGASYRVSSVAINDKDGIRTVTSQPVTVKVNSYHGAVANFANQTSPGAPVTGPVAAQNGTIFVCKSGTVSGSFSFVTTATGTTSTDTVFTNVSLTSGQCQKVFVRPLPGTTGAVVTISEGSSTTTTLTGVTVNGTATPAPLGVVTVVQGMEAGKVIVFTNAPATAPAALVSLGAASSFGILAGTTVTCVTGGIVNADVGISPGNALTGFGPCVVNGTQHLGDPTAALAQLSLTSAYNTLAGLPCPPANVISADIGGTTKAAGVYCSGSSIGLTGTLTLDGGGDSNATFVFQAGSTLTAAGNVVLINGAQAKNVYFQVGSSATLGTSSQFQGNILAFSSITLNDNVTLIGRALARNAAVTLGNNNIITLP